MSDRASLQTRDNDELESLRCRVCESEQWMQLALDTAELGLWDWDVQTGTVSLDERAAAMLGYTPDEIEPQMRSWEKLVHPDDWPGTRQSLTEHVEGRRPRCEAECRLRHKSGGWVWVAIKGKVTARDDAGRPLRVRGTQVSIAPHKEAEAAQQEIGERHRRLWANIPVVVYAYALRPDGTRAFRYVSPAARELLGLEPEDVMRDDTRLSDLIHPDDRARRDESIQRSAQTLQPWRQELRHIVNGQVRWYDCTSRPELQPDGTMLWDGVMLEITDRKQAEEKLRESEHRFHSLYTSMAEGVALYEVVRDERGVPVNYRLVDVNSRCEQMTGLAAERVVGKLATEAYGGPEPPYLREFTSVLDTRQPAHIEVYSTSMAKHFAVSVAPLGADHFATIFFDVTDRKQAEEQSRRREAELHRQDEVLLNLMTRGTLFGGDLSESLAEITEAGAELLQTERVSVWWYDADRRTLRCADVYERSGHRHASGDALHSADFPAYTQSHQQGRVIAATDVYTDPRTCEIPAAYWQGHDIRSLMDAPVWVRGSLGGVVRFEHVGTQRCWSPDEERLATMLATLVSLCAENAERWRSEAALRESETKYRALFEAAGDAIFVLGVRDGELHVVECNERALGMFGMTRQQAHEMPVASFWAPQQADGSPSREAGSAHVARVLESGVAAFEWRHRRLDGTVFDTDVVLTRVLLGTGQHLLALVRDITQRKQTEEALRARERLLNNIIDQNPYPMWLSDDEGTLIRVNPTCCDMLGIREEELVGKYNVLKDNIVTEQGRLPLVQSVFNEGKTVHFTLEYDTSRLQQFRPARTTCITIEVTIAPVKDERGAITNAVFMHRDISQRVRAENELRESERKYRALSQEVQAILEAIPGSVALISPDLKFVWANKLTATSIGLTLPELLGQPCYRCRHDRDKPCEVCAVQRCFASGKPESGEGETAGGRIWEIHTAPLFNDQGEVKGVIESAYEVTERRRAERELKANESMLRSVFRAIPIGISFNIDRVIVSTNEETCELTGYSEEEILGHNARMFYATQEEYDRTGQALYAEIQRSGWASVETHFRRKDGRIIDVLLTGAMLRDEEPSAGFVVTAQDITERKRAEQALRDNEAMLQSIFRAAPVAIGVVSSDRIIQSVNDCIDKILGYRPEELIGQDTRILYLTEEEYRRAGRAHYEQFQQFGITRTEHRMRRKDGSEVYIMVNRAPLRWGDPNAGSVFTLMDITERKTAEQALQSRMVAMTRPLDDASALKFSDLFDIEEIQKIQDAFAESSGVAALLTDPDGVPITRPSRFCRLCADFVRQSEKGRQKCMLSDAALGRVCIEGPTVRPCLSAGLWGAGASIMVGGKHIANWLIGQVRSESLDLDRVNQYAQEIGADPEEFRQALLEVPVMSEEQFRKVAHTLFVLSHQLSAKAYQNVQQARFITDLKRAEDERDRLFNSSIDLLSIGSLDGRFKQVNPAWTRALGWSEEELKQMHPSKFVHPDDVAAAVAASERLRQGQELRSFENRFRCKDGTYRWLSWNSYPLLEQGLVFSVCRDITERKAAEEERAKLEAQLRQSQKMEAVGQLAGGVAHDFNNILTAIFGHVELAMADLREHLPTARNTLDGMQQIQRSAERASSLTRQLLAFSRRQVTRPVVLDLNATLRDLQKMLHRLITESIDLAISFAPTLPAVEVDPGQLEQVIVNLVVNARDAMLEGGKLVLQTSAVVLDASYVASHADAHAGEHVLLSVSDTGCGMDSATLERIFEPFFTTKPHGHGTGLGLSTVYGIVKQAGGHVTVYSEPGHGTVFKIYLPSVHKPVASAQHGRSEPAPPVGTETILLCEDDSAVRELAAHVLAAAGYVMLVAQNAGQALQMASDRTGPIHLLLTDVIMPDMNGRKLADALKTQRPSVKTLYMSGYTSDVIAHHGVLEKDVNFLEKPFNRRALLFRVREVLDQPAPAGTKPRQ